MDINVTEYTGELNNLILYAGIVFVLVAGMIVLSFVLGERHRERATGEPYESGIASTGSARLRFSGQFYVIAMFFVIFDLETVFLIAWAISFKETGWSGYAGMLVFLLFLVSVFIYEWRIGALSYAVSGKTIIRAVRELKKNKNRL